jgi:hypothetical protein
MKKTPSNGTSQNYNLNANEDFVIFLASKSITCFIDNFTFGMKSLSIAYSLSETAHIYWILDFEGECTQYEICGQDGLQKYKGNVFPKSDGTNNNFQSSSSKNLKSFLGSCLSPIHLPLNTCRQCSRLKPSYEFHFQGLSNFSSSVWRLIQIQRR